MSNKTRKKKNRNKRQERIAQRKRTKIDLMKKTKRNRV